MLLSEAASGLRLAPASSAAAGQNRNQARQLMTPEERQAAQKERLVKKFSAKSAVYENCKMYSQDGDLLCYCDLRKLIWYEVTILAVCLCEIRQQSCLTFSLPLPSN